MKKIREFIIRLLGGVSFEMYTMVQERMYREGLRSAYVNTRRYMELRYGTEAEAWCSIMYAYVQRKEKEITEELERNGKLEEQKA